MSEKPAIVDTLPTGVKAANEAINAQAVQAGFDAAAFFAVLRNGPLRHRAASQVAGTEAILAAMKGKPISWAAYALATAWHETGAKMQPNVESLNYSVSGLLKTFSRARISRADAEAHGRKEGRPANQRAIGNIIYGGAWGRDNLGNTEPNDGFTYRGRGLEHVTGRRNYDRTGKALSLDLLANPDALLDLATAVRSLVTGMETGRYVRDHDFARHLPLKGDALQAQFREARRIINGVDKADLLAGYAMTFQKALNAGGWR
jgi:predicted chitinase